jgi:catechol 2,3-dioxygenase-like lactoylglutathione lyase family enzyme
VLSEFNPVATLPTADLSRARSFYEGTLGFAPGDEEMGGITYACGNGVFFVYESEYPGTNQATAMTFKVPMSAFDAEIGALREKGVPFQTFEAEGLDWNDGVASVGDAIKAVWFTDHDGNIINVFAGEM